MSALEVSLVVSTAPLRFLRRYPRTTPELDGQVPLTEWFWDETFVVVAIDLEVEVPVSFRLDMVDLLYRLPQMFVLEGMIRELITSRHFEFNAAVSAPPAYVPKADGSVPVSEAPGRDPDRSVRFQCPRLDNAHLERLAGRRSPASRSA